VNVAKIKKALRSSLGVVDIQSVMVGVIISGIIAGTAVVSLIGFTRMLSDDNARTTLKTFSTGMESYYTDKDRYPASVTELADGKYVPQSYKTIPITELCYVPAAGTQPQSYVATAKATTTGSMYSIVPDATDTSPVDVYPDTAAGTTPCKK
jgi:type II secretory pathway pseudopilin PulG